MQTPRDYLRKIGRRGGKARAKALTRARRRAIAKMGAAARWKTTSKRRTKKELDRQATRADIPHAARETAA